MEMVVLQEGGKVCRGHGGCRGCVGGDCGEGEGGCGWVGGVIRRKGGLCVCSRRSWEDSQIGSRGMGWIMECETVIIIYIYLLYIIIEYMM